MPKRRHGSRLRVIEGIEAGRRVALAEPPAATIINGQGVTPREITSRRFAASVPGATVRRRSRTPYPVAAECGVRALVGINPGPEALISRERVGSAARFPASRLFPTLIRI